MIHNLFFEPIHALSKDPLIKNVALVLSYEVAALIAVFVLVWALAWSRRRLYSTALLVLTGVTAWFLAHYIKVLVRLPRPFVEMGFEPGYFEPGYSFPSEHATVMTALAFGMLYLDRKIGRFLVGMAVAIGISRIILGVHYPIDILAGMWLGYFVFWCYKKLFQRI